MQATGRVCGCASERQGRVSAPHVVERAITMADLDADDIGISFGSFTVADTKQSSNDYSHVRICLLRSPCCSLSNHVSFPP